MARSEILVLMEDADPEPTHSRQVARLAERLFDELSALHGCGPEERFHLEAAALLHDTGWSVCPDGKGHHKASADLIRNRLWRGLDAREVALVAQIARYHRKSLPHAGHSGFMALSAEDRLRVEKLAALLRIADGLDRKHLQRVADLEARIDEAAVRITVFGQDLAEELAMADGKADLARKTFGRTWLFGSA